jgi:thioredoxin-like negative regulator of GroEL
MQRHTAQNKFGQADQLFQQGRFDEALALLDELDQAFPNSPNVMFPRARCLVEIGETNEAMDLLDELVLQFQHEEAMQLKGELQDAMLTLTQAPVAEARHHDGPRPEEVRRYRSSTSHAGSAPVMSKGNMVFVGVIATLLMAFFIAIIAIAM